MGEGLPPGSWHKVESRSTQDPPKAALEQILSDGRECAATSVGLVPDGGTQVRDTRGLFEQLLPVEMQTVLDSVEDGILLINSDMQISGVNESVLTDTGHVKSDLVGTPVESIISFDANSSGSLARTSTSGETAEDQSARNQEVLEAKRTRYDGYLHTATDTEIPIEIQVEHRQTMLEGTGYILLYHLEDPEDSHRRNSQRERLGIVNQYNTALRKLTRAVIDSSRRADLEQTICEELTATPPYEFAIVAEQSRTAGGSETVEPSAWAGIKREAVEALLEHIGKERESECPISQAIATGRVQTTADIEPDSLLRTCLGEDVGDVSSVAVTPIQYRDTTYGVLAVYANRPDPFENYEIRMLEDLGSIVGFVYSSMDKNELLVSDSVIELQFEITDSASFFVSTSATVDCTIELRSVVPRTDGRLLYYHRVTGVAPDRIGERAEDSGMIRDVSVIREEGDESLIAFQLSETSLVEKLSLQNMNVRRIIAEDGVVNLTIEISPAADASTATSIIDTIYDDYELVGKRRREQPPTTSQTLRPELLQQLTDRQRDVLIAAYENGYFDRPRTTTADEVSSQIGIAASTFHQHLREGLQKLVAGVIHPSVEKSAPWE